ncbi:hypothetical protein T266_18400 [Pseudomonas aeruginosa VRFPA05]|nr:hypothetical protein T266_18400 [Pseudomonas aeruginosa VRFPA05]
MWSSFHQSFGRESGMQYMVLHPTALGERRTYLVYEFAP